MRDAYGRIGIARAISREFADNHRAIVGLDANFAPPAVGKLLDEDAVTHVHDRKPRAQASNSL